jgi:hypothetical protein
VIFCVNWSTVINLSSELFAPVKRLFKSVKALIKLLILHKLFNLLIWAKSSDVLPWLFPIGCVLCVLVRALSVEGPRFPRGYLGKKTPREAPQNPPKNRTPAPPAAPAKKSPPATAPPKQPVAATTNDPKSFADATPAIKKVVFDLLDAIQSSSSTEEILKKVLAIIPNLLSNC